MFNNPAFLLATILLSDVSVELVWCIKFPIKITMFHFTPTLLLQEEFSKNVWNPGDLIAMSSVAQERLNPHEQQLTQKGYFTFRQQT